MHCVDLGERFQTHIFLQNFASIQPRTSPVKFARSSGAHAVRVADALLVRVGPGAVNEVHEARADDVPSLCQIVSNGGARLSSLLANFAVVFVCIGSDLSR